MTPDMLKSFKTGLEKLLSEHAMTMGHIEISPGVSLKKSILDEDNDAVFINLIAIKKPS